VNVRLVLVALAAALAATLCPRADAAETPASDPRPAQVHLLGVWPNRLRLFDEATEQFIGDIALKYGAATNSTHTPDFSKFYFVTDRMEAVEVVDIAKRQVVDTLKLSDQGKQVRIASVAVNPDGTVLYLASTPVQLEIDRFVPQEPEVFVYDLVQKRLKESFKIPKDVNLSFRPNIHFSPDGQSIFLFGRDIYELRASDNQLVGTIKLSKPLLAGYGPLRGARLTEEDPGIYYGLYRTEDPVMKKKMIGVVRIDLTKKDVQTFEVGPDLKVGILAISADRKRAYAGLEDMLVIDMDSHRIVKKKERVEQGRNNTTMIASSDGKKLYVGGVGNTIEVYDAETLEHLKSIFAGGDFMSSPTPVPRERVVAASGN
jgi:DNA-binding beta-propeller fold protein YncE